MHIWPCRIKQGAKVKLLGGGCMYIVMHSATSKDKRAPFISQWYHFLFQLIREFIDPRPERRGVSAALLGVSILLPAGWDWDKPLAISGEVRTWSFSFCAKVIILPVTLRIYVGSDVIQLLQQEKYARIDEISLVPRPPFLLGKRAWYTLSANASKFLEILGIWYPRKNTMDIAPCTKTSGPSQ